MNSLSRFLKPIMILAMVSGLGGLFVSAEANPRLGGLLLAGLAASAAVMSLTPVRQALRKCFRFWDNATVSGDPLIGASVQLTSVTRGPDEAGHETFCIRSPGGEEFFGEYFEMFVSESDFNIEIGAFGFDERDNVGNPYPSARLQFSVDECRVLENIIRKFFSNLDLAQTHWKYVSDAKFLGGVSFRSGWIVSGRGGPTARMEQRDAAREKLNWMVSLILSAIRKDWKV
jgi:hypothetical protein